MWTGRWHPLAIFAIIGALCAVALVVRIALGITREHSRSDQAADADLSIADIASELRIRSAGQVRSLRTTDGLFVLGIVLWAIGVSSTQLARAQGRDGLIPALPWTFWSGLALLLIFVGIELFRPVLSRLRLVAAIVSFVMMIQGSLLIIYPEPRYFWDYKTVGEVQYDNIHGSLNLSLDIYQHWPGFIGLMAWFGHVSGINNPISFVSGSPLFFDLFAVAAFGFAVSRFPMTEREKWLSVFLFYAGDWVFSNIQDIFTPQALAFPISLIIIGMVGRSYVVYAPSVELRRLRLRLARSKWLGLLWRSDPEEPTASPLPSMWRAGSWKPLLMLLIVFVPLVFTHPLSPFIIVLEVAALTIVNRVRPLWLFAILGAIAALYLTINETFLTNHHDAITGPKSIVQNAAPPTNVVTHIGPNHVVLPLITVALFGFAAIGALSRLYDQREVRVFAVLAIAPLMIVGLVHYGGETLYRALLFSTPWAACLGASAARPLTERAHSKRSVEGIGSAKALRMAATAAMIGVMTVMLLVVNDSQNELYQASGPDLSAASGSTSSHRASPYF